MATLTTNYQLKKPATSDSVSIADINDNMDIVDTQMKAIDNAKFDKSGGAITGKVNLTSTAEFKFLYHAERRFTGLSPSPKYTNWDADKKDGNWHRIWRISFPSNSNFWGRFTIGIVGSYSSFNASGYMEKEINLAFNTSTCYNNVGRYISLGGNVEKDFRISEAIWNSNTSKWEILIYSNVPNGNNPPSSIILSCETNKDSYMSAFENITVSSNCEISDIVTYNNVRGRFDGSTLVKSFKDLPVYESPYGYPIITTNELNPIVGGLVPKTGTTMTGALVAQTNTNYSTAQMRNVIISTSDPSGGSSGDIWIKYS